VIDEGISESFKLNCLQIFADGLMASIGTGKYRVLAILIGSQKDSD